MLSFALKQNKNNQAKQKIKTPPLKAVYGGRISREQVTYPGGLEYGPDRINGEK